MKTVFISGAFDGGLHTGHLYILAEARKFGDRLFVGLNSDQDVRRRKGEGRPIVPAAQRVEALYNTKLVDHVYIFGGQDWLLSLILAIKPNFIVVGSDYELKDVVGAKECVEWNGRVEIVKRLPGISTTEILEKGPAN